MPGIFTIDSHQHYWKLNQFDYAWLSPGNATLYQDRLPEHPPSRQGCEACDPR
ncbi:MAG: hypothetical protein M1434_03160 [Chloroflexi bacterium]|nr:hypothetical protein [Chloroflexota bacterium]